MTLIRVRAHVYEFNNFDKSYYLLSTIKLKSQIIGKENKYSNHINKVSVNY